MQIYSATKYPLRFSSIFWIKNQVFSDDVALDSKYTFFETNVVVNDSGFRGHSLNVGSLNDNIHVKSNHAYRLDGQVGIARDGGKSLFFEDTATTIPIDKAEVRPQSMANNVLAQGHGKIVDWFGSATDDCIPIEVIRVSHRYPDVMGPQREEFFANDLLPSHLTLPLDIEALTEGNIISLRGKVVAYEESNRTWIIEATDIDLIYSLPNRRRSLRQQGLPPQ
ncbi:uncharacterized protein MELLADRAFT_93846 [Melampsora larici-populina 98AG31]|uniref:Uncharacterized protein n=1 Tax=Melampsora larici-populina (strain 98AG31 / pathotype 3-4-7) TaxID=747676 RepID=F4S5G5_MELLP|nr:uncharacterized protein MELLADRAFT_93846 [Melampsora larici-populina 98AG31]EGG00167.1 hypothetical protein MELLADRAFT_93846 [Melampsora larici-populina 98AG31]